ncbi:MAG: hypothetical protein ACM3PE_01865 [Deltaproteobacteria bacterium]
MERPSSLLKITEAVETLAIIGEIPTGGLPLDWLTAIGVGESNGERFIAGEEWVCTSLTVRNSLDLLRRLAFRDPGYRLYLDSLLAQVLQGMARADRLEQVEELLGERLRGFALRLVLTMRYLEEYSGHPVTMLNQGDWEAWRQSFFNPEDLKVYHIWDRELFADIPGGPEQLFPLLLEHYGPITSLPVYWHTGSKYLSDAEAYLLTELIRAGQEGEGVYLEADQEAVLDNLIRIGLPLRQFTRMETHEPMAGCWGTIMLLAEVKDGERELPRLPRAAIPELIPLQPYLTKGCVIPLGDCFSSQEHGFWAALEKGMRPGTFPGTSKGDLHPFMQLKGEEGSRSGKGLNIDDQIILDLADHPANGLLLQLLLAKSLEAGVGDDCITIIRGEVYYRPRARGEDIVQSCRVGNLEEVMAGLANVLGMFEVPALYSGQPKWAGLLERLRQAGGILANSEEVMLAEEFFLRCHSWVPMQDVIGRGSPAREKIHRFLRLRWEESSERMVMVDGE